MPGAARANVTTVRPFQEADADAVKAMMDELAVQREESTHQLVLRNEYARFFSTYMKTLLASPDSLVRVAEDQGTVVGYVIATRGRDQPFLKFNKMAVLNDMFVAASHRNKGVGKQLMATVRQWATKHGLDALEVNAFTEHKSEIQALEKLGFFQSRVKMLMPLHE